MSKQVETTWTPRFYKSLDFKKPNFIRRYLLDNRRIDDKGCWNWTRSKLDGYGQMRISGRKYPAHRVSLYLYKGFDIRSNLFVLHKCDNKRCFNPKHLRPGTHKENVRDAVERQRNVHTFNPKQIAEIRTMGRQGRTHRGIASLFGVSHTTIRYIINRNRYFLPPYV